MKVIYKYELSVNPSFNIIQMPAHAVALDVQVQHNKICLWAIVDTENKLIDYNFVVYGTGYPLPDDIIQVALKSWTVQSPPYVWHVFALPVD